MHQAFLVTYRNPILKRFRHSFAIFWNWFRRNGEIVSQEWRNRFAGMAKSFRNLGEACAPVFATSAPVRRWKPYEQPYY
jgi:hypothetical protein